MKTQKQRKTVKTKAFIISGCVIALLVIAAAMFFYNRQADVNTIKSPTSSPESSTNESEQVTTDPNDKQVPSNTDTPASTQKDNSNNKTIVQMTVSASVSGETVYIRGGINNASVNNGTCYAQLTSSSGSLRKDTELLQNASTTDCKTIAINTSDLSKGAWSVALHYSSDSMEGVSNDASFEVK